MAKEQHLTYFKVENFKRFDSLELTDIGQFNLIVGDNNVGKTSLLEALISWDGNLVDILSKLHSTLYFRGIYLQAKQEPNPSGKLPKIIFPEINYLTLLLKDIKKPLIFQFKKKVPDGREISIVRNADKPDPFKIENVNFPVNASFFAENGLDTAWLYADDFTSLPEQRYLPILKLGHFFGHDLAYFFNEQVGLDRTIRAEIEENMKMFIPDLEYFRQIIVGEHQHLVVGQKGQKLDLPLASFGDGTSKILRVILEVLKNKGKQVLIDEIDTGIHHSRMKEFLKTVFKVAELNDVQLFMTTHSLECQQAFVEVFEDPEMVGFQKDVRQFSLIETPEKQIVASGRNFEQLQHSLEIGFDTRGGKRGW